MMTTTIIFPTDVGDDQEFKKRYVQLGHWPDKPKARKENEDHLRRATTCVLCWQADIRDRRATKLIVDLSSVALCLVREN